MRRFAHSGDLGDIVYALPTIRAAGGGSLTLFNFPGRTTHAMSEEKVSRIRPLLMEQDYISGVYWSEVREEHNLNGFRDHYRKGNLADMHLGTHGFSWRERLGPWLTVSSPRAEAAVIISRSERYENTKFSWQDVMAKYGPQAAFLGTEAEHAVFCNLYGELPLVDAPDLLEVARVIAGSKLFIGNQSCPAAIAHGLQAPMIQVVCPDGGSREHCIFNRMNCILAWDDRIDLPTIERAPNAAL